MIHITRNTNVQCNISGFRICLDDRTWFDIFRCVSTELFPALSIMMRQCLDEILNEKPDFKLADFSEDAVVEIMERLKQKRTMNNTEIEYLTKLIQRAAEPEQTHQRLVDTYFNPKILMI